MTYQTSGTYYYSGTGSVANVTGSATNQSYSYTASGSMTAFVMSASAEMTSDGITGILTTNPTAYGTYGVYGYNGEYTHTNLGLQYLRARYLNVATGTFTSRDTYAGKLQDILSQNRYTYAENNPVGHSDPSGHKVVKGSTRTRALQATANSIRNYAQTQRLATMTTSERARAATVNSIKNYVKEQKSVIERISGTNINKGTTLISGLSTIMWVGSHAEQIEKAACASYGYCVNKFQESIAGRVTESIISIDDINRWMQDIREKSKDKNGTYTMGINISFTPALWQFDGTLGISFDRRGNVALQWTKAAGVTASDSITGAIFLNQTFTNAPTVDDLNGEGAQVGGSIIAKIPQIPIPIALGGDINVVGKVNDHSKKYYGLSYSIGTGNVNEPIVGEVHAELGDTKTLYDFNLFDSWDKIYNSINMNG